MITHITDVLGNIQPSLGVQRIEVYSRVRQSIGEMFREQGFVAISALSLPMHKLYGLRANLVVSNARDRGNRAIFQISLGNPNVVEWLATSNSLQEIMIQTFELSNCFCLPCLRILQSMR